MNLGDETRNKEASQEAIALVTVKEVCSLDIGGTLYWREGNFKTHVERRTDGT